MCGICGIFTADRAAAQPEFQQAVARMTRLMIRRGPDYEGFWHDPNGHLQLGFRRLAILDLSPAGQQPMVSGDGRSVLVFSGEVYNFPELRRELAASGIAFRSRTDSEVVLEALNRWGIDALDRFNGMFALAWYDRVEHRLILARDHAGIKPLYYLTAPDQRGLAFASQFNCLLHTPWGSPGGLRLDVLRLFLQLHHIPPPYGLLENTHQLEPGHYLLVRPDGSTVKRAWWTLPRDPEPDRAGQEALETMRDAIDGAVKRQRIADVPLGVFLSGGVDSPLVTAIAREQTGPSLKAFTISNPGWWQDEAEVASTYARCLDLDHRLYHIDGVSARRIVADVIEAQPEPLADYSIIPTLLVSEAARTELTVALSGDGGDELFWGYERPLSLLRNGADFVWPWPVRAGLYLAGQYGLGPRRSGAVVYRSPGHYYFDVNCRLKEAMLRQIAPGLAGLPGDFRLYDMGRYQGLRHLANYTRWVEFYGQLQRGLKKVDMASMYHSLEVRVPLLDREVIAVSLRLDPFEAMRNGTRKALLRDLLARYVSPDVIPRHKLGFAVPLGAWLRGELRPLVEETLLSAPLYPDGVFDQEGVRHYWDGHLSGQYDAKWGVWTLLVWQWWVARHLTATLPDEARRPARNGIIGLPA